MVWSSPSPSYLNVIWAMSVFFKPGLWSIVLIYLQDNCDLIAFSLRQHSTLTLTVWHLEKFENLTSAPSNSDGRLHLKDGASLLRSHRFRWHILPAGRLKLLPTPGFVISISALLLLRMAALCLHNTAKTNYDLARSIMLNCFSYLAS